MLRLTANSKKSFKDPFQYSVSPKVWAVFRIRLMCGRHNQTHQSVSMESSKIYVLSILQLFDRTNCVSSPRKTVALSDCRLQPRGDLVLGFSSSIPHWQIILSFYYSKGIRLVYGISFLKGSISQIINAMEIRLARMYFRICFKSHGRKPFAFSLRVEGVVPVLPQLSSSTYSVWALFIT